MTVTIHVPQAERADTARWLIELADGDRTAVQPSTAGLVVTDTVALAYLRAQQPPMSAPAPKLAVPSVSATAREAEVKAGIVDDTRVPATGSGARATRSRKTAAAPSEEQQ